MGADGAGSQRQTPTPAPNVVSLEAWRERANATGDDDLLEEASVAATMGDLREVLRLFHRSCPIDAFTRDLWVLNFILAGALDEGEAALARIADPLTRAALAKTMKP